MRTLIILTTLLWTTQVGGQAVTHCLDDVNSCLPNFRDRLIDNDHFWFGTPYSTQCPGLVYCINDRPDLQSVASRILVTNDTTTLRTAVANTQVLNVTFLRPAVSFFACDKTFDLAASAPKTLDPIRPANLPQIYVQTQPIVTWTPAAGQPLYSFILYDASYLFLHTLFINCPGGSLDGCEVVRPWMGSAAGFLINSAYTYVVFEQSGRIPIADAQQATQQTAAEGMVGATSPLGNFYITSLLQKLTTYYSDTDIKFASIMEMYPDPYGSSRLTNLFVNTDQCPLFYTQLPPFHSAVRAMQIPNLAWSADAFGFSQSAVAPYLTTINVNVHVTYETNDFSVTACCENFQVTRGSHLVSPLDNMPLRASITRKAPRVFLTPVILLGPGAGRNAIAALPYTLVVVDATPVISNNATDTNVTVHWLVANIFGSEFPTGTELVQYTPPAPGNPTSTVALMFLLFTHSTPVNPSLLSQLCPNEPTMCQLNMTDLISTWNLGNIVGVNWVVSEEDGFSLKYQYTQMRKAERDVCRGRAGYASPCPTPQPCSAIGQADFSHAHLIGLLAAAIVSYYMRG